MIWLIAIVAVGLAGYLAGYDRGFDSGWVHGRLGGRRKPWEAGEAWLGNGMTSDEIAGIDVVDGRF